MRFCAIPACGKMLNQKDGRLCRKHYARKRRHGNPLKVVNLFSPTQEQKQERFWANVYKTENCWFWIGASQQHKNSVGYGRLFKGHAHRFSFELHRGPIPKGMQVLHECDNPRCVNPEHLFLGNHSTNQIDRFQKGIGCMTNEDRAIFVACDTPGCENGYVDGILDEKCNGDGRIRITDTQERQSVREAISGYLGALHRVAEALGKVGRQ